MSGEVMGQNVDIRPVAHGMDAADTSGVANARELVALAEAVVEGDEVAVAHARERLLAALGPEGLVDAAAVVGNFQRMVRIADGIGIPLDGPMAAISADIRDELDLARFPSAANTPAPRAVSRLAGRLLRPFAVAWLRRRLRPGTPVPGD